MKITLEHLGTIEKTALDLRPMTIVIGPNNTSKTYVAYSIYGLWKSARALQWPRGDVWKRGPKGASVIARIDDLRASLDEIVPSAAQAFQREMAVFFQDSSHKLFNDTRFQVRIDHEDVERAARETVAWLGPPSVVENDAVVLRIEPPSDDENDDGDRSSVFPSDLEFLAEGFMAQMLKVLFADPFLLPAERNAFIITYKHLANRRYKALKDAQRELFGLPRGSKTRIELFRDQVDIRFPKPVEDFLDFLTDTELSADVVLDPTQKDAFSLLADRIEAKIQNKNKPRLRPTTLGGREIQVDVKRGLSIDLYNASSSIKQLTPLLLYLRYKAEPNDFLLIDEPEMNLHPSSQAKLLEVLGIMVNSGVRVLITTHSPYFVAHLNNLLIADFERPEVLKKQAASLYLGDERAFLPPEQVSAYEMRDGGLVSLKAEDRGLVWDTLSEIAGELQQKFAEISSRKAMRRPAASLRPPAAASIRPPAMPSLRPPAMPSLRPSPPPSIRTSRPSVRPPPSSGRTPSESE